MNDIHPRHRRRWFVGPDTYAYLQELKKIQPSPSRFEMFSTPRKRPDLFSAVLVHALGRCPGGCGIPTSALQPHPEYPDCDFLFCPLCELLEAGTTEP